MKSWYSIKAMAGKAIDIDVHDESGLWGVSAKDFCEELCSHSDVSEINLSINSPGGNAFDGLAMYHALIKHSATVNASVLGVAASAASIVLMAGDTISVPEDAFVMIHNPWSFAAGDADELRDTADFLDKIRDSLVSIYAKRTGMENQDIVELLDNETWLNGTQAKELGFADEVTNQKVAALANGFAKHFKQVPVALQNQETIAEQIGGIDSAKEFEHFLREAGGFSKGMSQALTARAKALHLSESDGELVIDTSSLIKTLRQSVGDNS